MMRVLIVGCGYVGLPLGAELVRLGHEVFGLRRSAGAAGELKAVGVLPLIGDVTKPETLAELPGDFDWVVNCVAAGGNAATYREVYLHGTRNLIAWLAPHPPAKLVYTSSTSVYAQNDGSEVTESSPVEPLAETSRILVETEKTLLAAVAERGFPAVILRVAGIYGPERGHWFKQFLQGAAELDGDGARYLNMIHRDDVARCIIAALQRGRPGEIYNAADDEPVSQRHFFEWLARTLGQPMPPSGPANHDPLRRRGVTNKRVSNTRLRTELNCQLRFPDFRAGYGAEIARLQKEGRLRV